MAGFWLHLLLILRMTVWFVSRHEGARAWARRQGIRIDRWATHFRAEDAAPGDIVLGTLPFDVAERICAKGCRFFALSMHLSKHQRGCELDSDGMTAVNCRLVEFRVTLVSKSRADDSRFLFQASAVAES